METTLNDAFSSLVDKLEGWMTTIIEYLPNFGLALFVLVVSYFIAKYVNKYTYKLVSKKVKQESVAQMISRITAVVLVLVGLYISLGILNLSKTLTSLLATAGVAGLAIGLTLDLIHMVVIPITGTSVNPARSLGPAVFAGGMALQQLWLFIVAPIAGGILGTLIWKYGIATSDN